jgi:acylglycerol lipase
MIVRSDDGLLLYGESHPVENPRGSLLVIHGIGEHSSRYYELVKQAHRLRLDVHLMDLRGHGRSQGTRGHFRSLDELHQDIETWISHLVDSGALRGDVPLFLLGHSLGGLITITFAPKYVKKPLYPELAGLCLSSPCLGLRWNPLLFFESQVAKRIPPFLRGMQVPTGVDPDLLSHDKQEVKLYREDPLVHSWITPAAFLAMEKAIKNLYKIVPQLNLPILFLLSGRDKIVNTEAAEEFAKKLTIAHKGKVEVRVFHTFFHEPFHEGKRERAFLELKKWMLKCLPTTRSKKSSFKSSKPAATAKANSL